MSRLALLAKKAAVPVVFFLLLPFVAAWRAVKYFALGGRAEAAALAGEYGQLMAALVGRVAASCDGRGRAEVRYVRLEDRGVELETLCAGEAGAPLVVLLHGFPENFACFEHSVGPLVRAGFRVAAPHMRGYGGSSRPGGWRAYQVHELAADVAALVEELTGGGSAVVVGHDWGGQVAWMAAHYFPARVSRVVAVNSPHPVSFKRALVSDAAQALSSWYFFWFNVPFLPTLLALADPLADVGSIFGRLDGGRAYPEEARRFIAATWLQDGSYSAMLAYYRAAVRTMLFKLGDKPPRILPLTQPARVIWGVKDRYIGRATADVDPRFVPDVAYEFIEGCGHFSPHEAPREVAAAIVRFAKE